MTKKRSFPLYGAIAGSVGNAFFAQNTANHPGIKSVPSRDRCCCPSRLELDITKVRRQIAQLESKTDAEVAANPNLKKDATRKAERFHLLDACRDYQELLDDLANLVYQRATAMPELECVRNQFSVAKIEAKAAIAQQIAGLERAEFIGI